MATRLSNLVVEEISLVDEPANPGARVLVFKRKDPVSRMNPATVFSRVLATLLKRDASAEERSFAAQELQAVLEPDNDGSNEEDLDMTREELQEIIGGAVAKAVDPLKNELANLRKQMDGMSEEEMSEEEKAKKKKAAAYEDKKSEEEKPEEMAKRASMEEAVQKAVKPLQDELAVLRKSARDRSLLDAYGDVIKASGMAQDKAIELLAGMDEAARGEFAKGIRALAAQAKAGDLFKSHGSATGPAADAEAELDRLAKAKASEANVSYEVAYDMVCKTAAGRDLYERIITKAA